MRNDIFFIFILFIFFYIQKSNIRKYKNIIIIRFHTVTSSQLERYNSWKNRTSRENKYIYLTDVKYDKFKNMRYIYCIDSDEVLRNYPSLINSGRCKNRYKNFYLFAFHIEHIILCIKALLKKYRFKFIWILEQDVGYSGDINKLIYKYDMIKSDIITTQFYQSNSNWYYCCTYDYMKLRILMLSRKGYKTSEHIQRWSFKYYKEVNEMLNRKIHSQSEHASIEFSLMLNLTYHSIENNDIGYKYQWNSRVSKEEWNYILKNVSHQNKLFHAIKF